MHKETFETQEFLSPSARAHFAMGKHPGVKVRHISR